MTTTHDYNAEARAIAEEVGLTVVVRSGMPKCPPWGHERSTCCPYAKCRGYHGKHWRVTLTYKGGASYTFSFWSSVADLAKPHYVPTTYDVLACLDWHGETDPDAIAEEYGPMKPSQAIACAEQNKALRALIPDAKRREQLGEIQ